MHRCGWKYIIRISISVELCVLCAVLCSVCFAVSLVFPVSVNFGPNWILNRIHFRIFIIQLNFYEFLDSYSRTIALTLSEWTVWCVCTVKCVCLFDTWIDIVRVRVKEMRYVSYSWQKYTLLAGNESTHNHTPYSHTEILILLPIIIFVIYLLCDTHTRTFRHIHTVT